jgi:hypothetical protein
MRRRIRLFVLCEGLALLFPLGFGDTWRWTVCKQIEAVSSSQHARLCVRSFVLHLRCAGVSLGFLSDRIAKSISHGSGYAGTCTNIETIQRSGSVIVKALCYKPEGRWFESRWGEFFFLSIYLILQAALAPGVHSASNRNEYQKRRKSNPEPLDL